jgi:hypothetical protein
MADCAKLSITENQLDRGCARGGRQEDWTRLSLAGARHILRWPPERIVPLRETVLNQTVLQLAVTRVRSAAPFSAEFGEALRRYNERLRDTGRPYEKASIRTTTL